MLALSRSTWSDFDKACVSPTSATLKRPTSEPGDVSITLTLLPSLRNGCMKISMHKYIVLSLTGLTTYSMDTTGSYQGAIQVEVSQCDSLLVTEYIRRNEWPSQRYS